MGVARVGGAVVRGGDGRRGDGLQDGGEPMSAEIKEEDYAEATESYQGWCTHCESFTRFNVEPDARKYDCDQCHLQTVYGAEQALLEGMFTFSR
jgi:hypothetical protein